MSGETQLQHLLDAPESIWNCPKKYADWFSQQFRNDGYKMEDFAIYFLRTIRQCTDQHLRNNDGIDTPISQMPIQTANTSSQIETPLKNTSNKFAPKRLILNNVNSPQSPRPSQQQELSGGSDFSHIVSQDSSMFNNCTVNSQNLSQSETSCAESKQNSYTVHRKNTQSKNQTQGRRSQQNSIITSTPQSNERREKSNNSSSNFCLGDFITNMTPVQSKKKKKSPQVDNSGSKPKKRVVPTTISKNTSANASSIPTSPFGNKSSAFSNENNLLQLNGNTEIVDPNKCAVLKARKTLKLDANEISKELSTRQPSKTVSYLAVAKEGLEESEYLPPTPIDFKKIVNGFKLECLSVIYSVIIDLNLVPNVLSELAHMLQLLNLPQSSCDKANEVQIDLSKPLTLLYEFPNCVYFVVKFLFWQSNLLVQLDLKSLGVILNNERFDIMDSSVKCQLECVYKKKYNMVNQASSQSENSSRLDNSCKKVYYQHDKDSREYFSSQNEFGAFKNQRDLFYRTYNNWEANHLNPNFNFTNDLANDIRDIFRHSEHPVNMAHFAELFVDQLLLSANDTLTTPQELGIEIDQQKFSKLTQRLFAPSSFSVDYQFPRSQAYFRDFINECGSMAFQMQLKLALYAQLKKYNDSAFEQLQLSFNKKSNYDEDENSQVKRSPFIVRPDELSCMLILAKFLGYVTALPYGGHRVQYGQNIMHKQLELRSQFQPDFNIYTLLQSAIHDRKLLITIPWLVQYLAMLDNITLQLPEFTATLHLLFEIYSRLGRAELNKLQQTALFIIRCCIGWLLETRSQMTSQYYKYRAMRCRMPKHELLSDLEALIRITVYPLQKKDKEQSITYSDEHMYVDNILEQLLNVACPFLSEFRVTIMPAKYALTKCASRTGRYRHITTRLDVLTPPIEDLPNMIRIKSKPPVTAEQLNQKKLVEAFLESQHDSVRRLINFVTERTYKCVVKDAQNKILRPSKADADKKVNNISSTEYMTVLQDIQDIYGDACRYACQEWQEKVPHMMEPRIRNALDTLLPEQTNDGIKQAYQKLITQSVAEKVHEWMQENVDNRQFYCPEPQEMASKICRANKAPQKSNASTELEIMPNAQCSISELIDDLKYWLHVTSMRPDLVTISKPIEDFLERINNAFVHTLPTIFYYLLGSGLVQIFQHLISRHSTLLTRHMIQTACGIWTLPEMMENGQSDTPNIFDSLITANFIESLGESHIAFDALKKCLIVMIDSNVISLNFLNESFMAIFNEDWPKPVWSEISEMLLQIAQTTTNCRKGKYEEPEDAAKSHMFMEVLADFSRDLDF